MNANTQARGPGSGPHPSPRGDVPVDDLPTRKPAAGPQRTVHHVLLELQREFGNFGRDASGYGYKYVSLPKILDQLRPVLVDKDCLMTHVSDKVDADWFMTTTIYHVLSNTEISTVFYAAWAEMKGMSNPQTSGAYETYARRYNILKLLNCSVDDDDAADIYRATVRSIEDADSKEAIRQALTTAKTKLPRQTWLELVDLGKEAAEKLEARKLEGGDDADPISE